MNRLILILFIGLFAGIQSYSQSTYPISLNVKKENKWSQDFAEEGLQLEIASNAIEGSKFSISFTVLSNDKNYSFYTFQQNIPEMNSINELFQWARRNVDSKIKSPNSFAFEFDGEFLFYNDEFLSRQAWKDGWQTFNDEYSNIDTYSSINLDETEILTIKYVFLITDPNQRIVGLSNPISYVIPSDVIQAMIPEREEKTQIDDPKNADEVAANEVDDQLAQENEDFFITEDLGTEEKEEDLTQVTPSPRKQSCQSLINRYNQISRTIDDLRSEVNQLIDTRDKGISDGLVFLRKEMQECQDKDVACYNEIKKRLDQQPWTNQLNEYKSRLNDIENDYRKLESNEKYQECVNLANLKPDVSNIASKIRNTEVEIDKIKIEIERKSVDPKVLKSTIELFKEEVNNLVKEFHRIQNLYLEYDDLLFTSGNLKREQLKKLRSSIGITDSIAKKITYVLGSAKEYYIQNSERINFPEATFKNEGGLNLSVNDCNNLKTDLIDLQDRAKPKRDYTTEIILGVLVLILLIGGYAYFNALVRRKVNKETSTKNISDKGKGTAGTESGLTNIDGGIEIIEDEEESNKGKGIDTVRKLEGINYYVVDVQSFISDTVIRKVYFSKDFVIKAYQYFEDELLQIGNGSIDDLYEYGGYIIGNWDTSPYDSNQYDLSLEYFIQPGKDAKFSKFNIDFGYDISFRMEEMLIDNAKKGNEQIFVGWLHSHPGHNVFLSNYDIEVQERFKNQYHPHRHIALILEPTTPNWDLGLFTFNQAGEMNNQDDVRSLLSFHEIYNWAIGKSQLEDLSSHLKFTFEQIPDISVQSISFDKSLLLQLKITIERKITPENRKELVVYLSGIVTRKGISGVDIHLLEIKGEGVKQKVNLDTLGAFVVSESKQIGDLESRYNELVLSERLSILLTYIQQEDSFILIPIDKGGHLEKEQTWIEFPKSDILPYIIK